MNTIEEKKKATEDFFANAFCIDGKAEIISGRNFEIDAVVKMTDSKRGTFYVAQVNPKSKP